MNYEFKGVHLFLTWNISICFSFYSFQLEYFHFNIFSLDFTRTSNGTLNLKILFNKLKVSAWKQNLTKIVMYHMSNEWLHNVLCLCQLFHRVKFLVDPCLKLLSTRSQLSWWSPDSHFIIVLSEVNKLLFLQYKFRNTYKNLILVCSSTCSTARACRI